MKLSLVHTAILSALLPAICGSAVAQSHWSTSEVMNQPAAEGKAEMKTVFYSSTHNQVRVTYLLIRNGLVIAEYIADAHTGGPPISNNEVLQITFRDAAGNKVAPNVNDQIQSDVKFTSPSGGSTTDSHTNTVTA